MEETLSESSPVKPLDIRQPRGNIIVADNQPRAAGIDVPEPPDSPASIVAAAAGSISAAARAHPSISCR